MGLMVAGDFATEVTSYITQGDTKRPPILTVMHWNYT